MVNAVSNAASRRAARAEEARLSRVFSALADPTRRAIVARLSSGDASLSDLAAPFEMSVPAVFKHVRVLENAGLVGRGTALGPKRCRLLPDPLASAAEWLERYRCFWEGQLDALGDFLEATRGTHPPRRKSETS